MMMNRNKLIKNLEFIKGYVFDSFEIERLDAKDKLTKEIKTHLRDTSKSIMQEAITLLLAPTSEDVCEALSEWFKVEVYYNKSQREFYYDLNDESGRTMVMLVGFPFNTVKIYNGYFAPHLITLIGRFYEGIENNELR